MGRETDKTNSKIGESTVKNDKQKVLRLILSITTVLSILMLFSVFICLSLGQKIACISCTALLVVFGIASSVLLAIIVSLNKNAPSAFMEEVNEFVESYKTNDFLCKIVDNYTESSSINIFILEFTFLPLAIKKDLYNNRECYIIANTRNISSENTKITEYFKFVNAFSQTIIDKYISNVQCAFLLRDYCRTILKNNSDIIRLQSLPNSIKDSFLDVNELYVALHNQGVLEDQQDQEAYYAFLFLLYMADKKHFCNLAKTVLENYGLSVDDSIEKVIDTLYNNDIDEHKIAFYILAANSEKHNYLDIWNDEIDKLKQIVSGRIRYIKEKEKIQRLSEKNQEQDTVRFDIDDIDLMTGVQFEWFISFLFGKLGYATEITKSSGDQGIDIIAKKGNAVVAIQTKCYSKPVGNHAIMEAVAGAKYYNATKTMVVTNNGFTKSARDLAQANNVVLWDRAILKEKMNEINE